MVKKCITLLAITFSTLCSQEGEWFSHKRTFSEREESPESTPEGSQEEHDAAQAVARTYNVSIDDIAQKKNLDVETVTQALLWMSEHPSTPMPSTPLNYTNEDIEEAAEKYANYKAQKRAALQQLNKQEIMQKTGVTQEDIDAAFTYYGWHAGGALPETKERIEQLVKSNKQREETRQEYIKKNKKELEALNKNKIMQETGVTQEDIDAAFTYYGWRGGGALPETKERIEQLVRSKKRGSERKQEYREGNRKKLEALNKNQIIQETGATQEDVDMAFDYYRRNPMGALPTTKERIEQLAKKYEEEKGKYGKSADKKNKELQVLGVKLEESMAGVGEKDLSKIAADAGVSEKTVLNAFNMHKKNPVQPFPLDAIGLTDLAEQWNQHVQVKKRKQKEAHAQRIKKWKSS